MIKFYQEPQNVELELDIRTKASTINSKIKKDQKPMHDPEFKIFLRNYADEIHDQNIAFESHAFNLKQKLYAIWKKSIDYISKTEDKYKNTLLRNLTLINNYYLENNDPRNEKLALSTSRSIIDKSKDIATREYMLTLRYIYRIKNIYEINFKQNKSISNPFTDEFKELLFADENFESGKFINLIVQEFFPLSIHANELGKSCGLKLGIPISEEVRNYRSATGSQSSKALKALKTLKALKELDHDASEAISSLEEVFKPYGEEVLKFRIRSIIPKLNKNSKYRSIQSIIDDNEKLFSDVLIDYQQGIGSPAVKGGENITFGENLRISDLVDLIKKWKIFPEIKAHIKNLNLEKMREII